MSDPETSSPLLSISDLAVTVGQGPGSRTILSGVSLGLSEGETVGIVGESGSGKSMTAKSVMRLLPRGLVATGTVTLDGHDVLGMSESRMAQLRGPTVSLLMQDPFTMLNPLMTCGAHIVEGLKVRRSGVSRTELWDEAVRRLAEVGIRDADVARRYPFQLSGGMRQRVALAAALASDPRLLIADEPSTALDVTTQAEILELLASLQRARGMALLLITHDLRVAFSVCDRVHVFYSGRVLEAAPAADLAREPLHPYALGLLMSEPRIDRRAVELSAIPGSVPTPDSVAERCAFADRCAWREEVCVAARPALLPIDDRRQTACCRISEIRPELAARRAAADLAVDATAAMPAVAQQAALVTVDKGTKRFGARTAGSPDVIALNEVSITVGANESVGLVGESGSGKTTLGRCIAGLETLTSGQLTIDGLDASNYDAASPEVRRQLRRTAQIVFQDPYSSLNPRHSIGGTLRETLSVNGAPRDRISARIAELLDMVGLPKAYAERFPRSLSGGERQRVAIARALAVNPKLIVCDEPVSALDVSVQAQILTLFRELRQELGLSYLFITHDLAVVRQVVERVYVLYRSNIVEEGPVSQVLDRPSHAYTRRLIGSIPGQSHAVEEANT
ncbi:dipeptide ABC transporter ATP-binding protein [Devosia sp.]|uniref:dipeptide ABC transporter ATP-binding protein n=1 Tax=Devosia sp. TaxID=1871048 RepID=UPI003A9247AA